jgi:hypothetical protein
VALQPYAFASKLHKVEVALRNAAKLPGHRTLKSVIRYAHPAPRHQAEAVVCRAMIENQRDTRTDTGASNMVANSTSLDVKSF